ncbi:MAG: hypothetical protein ACHQRM_17845 [Bacteroidia bacterium]
MLRFFACILLPLLALSSAFYMYAGLGISSGKGTISIYSKEGKPESPRKSLSSVTEAQKDSLKAKKKTGPSVKSNLPTRPLDAATRKPKDSLIGLHNYYLEMRGLVRKTQVDARSSLKGPLLDSAKIEVFADSNRLVAVHYSSIHGECRFKLPLNRMLRLRISRKDYYSKVVDVNSKVPPEKKAAYIFPFDIDLFEETAGVDTERLKHPIAKVLYDHEKSNFEYDEVFTNTINRELKTLYKAYREKMSSDTTHPKK